MQTYYSRFQIFFDRIGTCYWPEIHVDDVKGIIVAMRKIAPSTAAFLVTIGVALKIFIG